MKTAVLLVGLFGLVTQLSAYKPLIMMHGLLSSPSEFEQMREWIEKAHPGTNVSLIDAFDHTASLFHPMWMQVEKVGAMMQAIMNEHPEGVHLLCFSQGGLLCRAILETHDSHNVHNFIALSSPQMGQYGATDKFRYFFPFYLTETLYKLFYTDHAQNHIAVANYWNDPYHQDMYLNTTFLPIINNQTYNNQSQAFKNNIIRLKNLIAIGGPDDGVITPWQSSQFAAFNKKKTVILMQRQKWYQKDWFGLKTLDKRKALHFHTIPGVQHYRWPKNSTVFECCILPYLT